MPNFPSDLWRDLRSEGGWERGREGWRKGGRDGGREGRWKGVKKRETGIKGENRIVNG